MNLIDKAKLISQYYLSSERFAHAERVASLLENPTEEEIVGAYLHDIFEDTNISEDYILKEFGKKITNIVKELTNPISIYRTKIRDFSHLKNATIEAKRIKLADRIDNVRKRLSRSSNSMEYVIESKRLLEILRISNYGLCGILEESIKKLEKIVINNLK